METSNLPLRDDMVTVGGFGYHATPFETVVATFSETSPALASLSKVD